MKAAGLMMVVGGWVIAVGGLLVVDDTTVRMAIALLGLGTSLAGVFTLNGAHLEHALWKTGRH